MKKSMKWRLGMLVAGIVGLVGSAIGAERGEIRFHGGHPWLSREQLVLMPAEQVPHRENEAVSEISKVSRANASRVVERGERIFDLTVSMYKHRDKDERKKIEKIFEYFARGVYQATKGRHKIGTVRIVECADGLATDIVWTEKGEPRATIFGAKKGGHISMFDKNESHTINKLPMPVMEYPMDAGHTLAHEWGHYRYGFGDEYADNPLDAVIASLMGQKPIGHYPFDERKDGIQFFMMNCNLSVSHSLAHPTGSGWWIENFATRQFELWGQSCLGLLATPKKPLYNRIPFKETLDKQGQKEKDYLWEEFFDIDPEVLPGENDNWATQPAATNEFHVLWPEDVKLVWAICLDHSGSMDDGDLELAKARTKLAIDQAPVGTLVGIFAFSSSVDNIVPFTEVTDANRASLKASVDSFSADGDTALWKAAYEALTAMEILDPEHNSIGSLLLMTDGKDNASGSITWDMVVDKCREMRVAFNSIAYGKNADTESLHEVAKRTGGKSVSATDSLSSVNDAFCRLLNYGSSRVTIVDEKGTTSARGTWTGSFEMDSSGMDLQVTMALSIPSQSATVVLVAPSGIRYAANSSTDVGHESSFVFTKAQPEAGRWTVSVTAPSGTEVSCFVDASASKVPPRLAVWVDDSDTTAFASVSFDDPVDGAVVMAVLHENGTERKVPFESIGGGMYKLNLSECGAFTDGFTVRADATKGVAKYTYVDVMDYMGDGEGTPIAESFTRSEWVALGKENAVTFYSSGKGKLEFQWRTSGDGVPDKIDFLCNGNTTATLVSGQGWTKKEIVFDEEEVHVFQWVTPSEVRKFSGTWLKEVIWHPEPDVAMGSIEVTPRWPWNGKLDIDFAFVPTVEGTKATFSVSGVDGDLGTTIQAKTLSGKYRNLDKGTYRVTWDLGADAPGFHSSAFAVQLDATIDPFPAPVVTVSSTASGGNRLEWDSVSGAESYSVFRGANAAGTGAVEIGTVKADAGGRLSFQDSAAPHGQTVWYAVKASAWKLDGERSAWVSARRPMLPPTNLAATYGTRTDGVLVSWTPSTGTGRSRIYRFVSSDLGGSDTIEAQTWGHAICETTNSSWLDTTTAPGVDYVYSATCVSPEGEESFLPTELYPPPTEILMEDATLMGGVSSTRIQSYSPAIGWRNMEAPKVTSATRKDTVQKGPGVWAPIYRNRARFAAIPIVGISRISKIISSYDWAVTSVFDLEWEAVPGALTYKIIHWPSSSSSETESAVTTPTSFSYSITKLSLVGIEYPASRTFRIVPMSAEHSGNATTIDIK